MATGGTCAFSCKYSSFCCLLTFRVANGRCILTGVKWVMGVYCTGLASSVSINVVPSFSM